jgi:hypothetical protein
VINTGDFVAKKRDIKLITDVYFRLSTLPAIFGRPTALILDREDYDVKSIETLQKHGLRVEVLDKVMYEDYLLSIPALNELLGEIAVSIGSSNNLLDGQLETIVGDVDQSAADRIKKIIETAFPALETYRKAQHGPRLTTLVLKHEPALLAPVAKKLAALASAV